MKKYLYTSFLMLLLLITAYEVTVENESSSVETVSPSQLTKEDKRLLDGVGMDDVFVFDLDLNNTSSSRIDTWIEYYEYGVKKEKIAGIGMENLLGDTETMKLIYSRASFNTGEENQEYDRFVISILSDGGIGKGDNVLKRDKIVGGRLTDKINKAKTLLHGKPQTLAVIIESSGRSMVHRITSI
ncbi:hypothetical protein [Alkalihalobacillus sp. AL-G]|uniref:hypothetical protein n=1 Tax=Alkalihalobacillus sp. AL-G TaxID=2926399 RepID=UPI002729E063|nr:hypothetical protein [Alkalihalobacillus sp. AL-G]WLD93902.1 hypothetical protein MOJ78_03000 [Alkalihalobacillus sp. AL-G]